MLACSVNPYGSVTFADVCKKCYEISSYRYFCSMAPCGYGQELQRFWNGIFGFGLDGLTELEASYLCRQSSIDKIRRRLATAAEKASLEGLLPVQGNRMKEGIDKAA